MTGNKKVALCMMTTDYQEFHERSNSNNDSAVSVTVATTETKRGY